MLKNILLVGLGGFAGSILRYLMGYLLTTYQISIPWPTMAVNLLGSFAIGVFAAILLSKPSEPLYLLLITGFCGGFTTFSTFAFENLKLIEQNQFTQAVTYILASLIFGVLAVLLGFWTVRRLLA